MAEAASELPKWPRLEGGRREGTVIIGAGLAGLGLAQSLRARGVDALVIDAVGPGHGASGRNAGFVLRTHVSAYPAFRRAVGPELARALLALAGENHARVARHGGTAHRSGGSVMLAASADEARLLEESRALLSGDGVRAEVVDAPMGLAGFESALLLPDDGEVHPARLVASLASGVRGGLVDVRAVERSSGRITFESGVLDADRIILATNARLSELIPSFASIVTPHRAQMLATAPIRATLDRPCYAGGGYDYFRQRADGRVLLGGRRHLFVDAERTTSTEASDEVQASLDAYLDAHLPFARGAVVEARWAGTMGFSADGLPLAGLVPGTPNVWALAGFTGHGLGLALALADRLADAIVADSPDAAIEGDLVLARLAPGRFSQGA
jgi:gamma-glutamylputrescine oxidase